MGNVSSAPDGAALYLKDQSRCLSLRHVDDFVRLLMSSLVSIASLGITNSRRRTILNVVPNAYPATRLSARRDQGDDTPVDFVQVHNPPLNVHGQ